MKSKITAFIMKLLVILMLAIIFFLGIIIYNEIVSTDIESEVQEFVSNITFSTGTSSENLEETEIIQSVLSPLDDSKKLNYFYEQLDSDSKIIYEQMEKNKENMKTGTYVLSFGTSFSHLLSQQNGEKLLGDCFETAIQAYTYDNPDVFYIDFGKLCLNMETTTKGLRKTYKVYIDSGKEANYLVDEFYSKEMIDRVLLEIEKIRTYFIQNKKENTYDNIKLVHDYLVESIEYDQTISESNIYNIYGALINKKCVCEGYAESFKYLMDGLDIPCIIVSGQATNLEGNTENHAWNYVKINELWYAIDCTWDDPIIIGPGFLTNSSKYEYFLKGSSKFNKTHIPNGQFIENGRIFEFPVLNLNNY